MGMICFQFNDFPTHDTYVLCRGKAGTRLSDAFQREIGSRFLSARARWLFAVILENDNGKLLCFVPDKKDHNLHNAKSAMKTWLTRAGMPQSLVGAMKYMDIDALNECGLFRTKLQAMTCFAQQQKYGPLNIENTELEAEQPDDAWEDDTRKFNRGIIQLSDHHRYLQMLKHVPASEDIEPIGWARPFDEKHPVVKPVAWEPQVEQGSGLESQMKALALEDAPADSGRMISRPQSKKGRTHDKLVTGPKVRVLLGPLAVPGYDGTLFIRKPKASKEYDEEQWMQALKLAVEEQMQGRYITLEEMYDTSSELMDQGALPEVERDPTSGQQEEQCRSQVPQRLRCHWRAWSTRLGSNAQHRIQTSLPQHYPEVWHNRGPCQKAYMHTLQ